MVHMKRKILFLKNPARPIEINLAGSFLWVQKEYGTHTIIKYLHLFLQVQRSFWTQGNSRPKVQTQIHADHIF